MAPREEVFEHARLILGDMLEVMPTLQPVHHVITDPPYEDHMHVAKAGARGIRTDGYASPKPLDFESITGIRDIAAGRMALAASGWIIAFCTPEGIAPWRDALEAVGARYKRACFWHKPDAAPQFNGQGPAMAVEAFVTAWNGDGHAKWNGGGRRNLFTHMTNNSERSGEHPAEKPLALMREIIELFTNPGEEILDPFAGSGSTGVAAIQTGRKFVGIERDEKYFDAACRRLEKASRIIPLFPAEAYTQTTMDLCADNPEPKA